MCRFQIFVVRCIMFARKKNSRRRGTDGGAKQKPLNKKKVAKDNDKSFLHLLQIVIYLILVVRRVLSFIFVFLLIFCSRLHGTCQQVKQHVLYNIFVLQFIIFHYFIKKGHIFVEWNIRYGTNNTHNNGKQYKWIRLELRIIKFWLNNP